MNNLNSILLEGALTRDPELWHTASGTPVCELPIVSLREYKVDGERVEEVNHITGITYGRLATVCAEHVTKGRGVRMVGRLRAIRPEPGPDGAQNKPDIVIVCEHVEFQPRRAGEDERKATVDENDRARAAGRRDGRAAALAQR